MHVAASSNIIYRAAVIGAGPAGIACVGNLLDNLPGATTAENILWIDPEFQGGRLTSYPAVPSNTKVCLFTKFAEECKSFNPDELKSLKILKEEFDGQKGCQLKWAGELCKEITQKLLKSERIKSIKTRANHLEHSSEDGMWCIKTSENDNLKCQMVFLTTGSRPKSLNHSADDSIDLDDALNPEILKNKVQNYDSVSVYGSSHSAMLVLKNLIDLPRSNRVILNYYRQSAKFASFPDPINCPDKILHDNTGLKGEVAEWVKTWIELDESALESKFNLKRIQISTNHDCNHDARNVNIFAVGYERNLLPEIKYNGAEISGDKLDYDAIGQLKSDSHLLNAIFGFGIAFPERVKDLDGSDEAAVGLWKFMKHIKKSIKIILK